MPGFTVASYMDAEGASVRPPGPFTAHRMYVLTGAPPALALPAAGADVDFIAGDMENDPGRAPLKRCFVSFSDR